MLKARSHPWIAADVPIRGFVFDVHTGRLTEVPARATTGTRETSHAEP